MELDLDMTWTAAPVGHGGDEVVSTALYVLQLNPLDRNRLLV